MPKRPTFALRCPPPVLALGSVLALATSEAMAQQSPGLAPPGTYTVAEAVADDYGLVAGVVVDVKVYRPVGLTAGAAAPVLCYGPGGGSGAGGTIPATPQHELLWRQLASAGLTILYLQNEAESAPGFNFWQLRGDIVLWAIGRHGQWNADFGTQLAASSPVLVAGWSLGAATVVQHAGADFGFGNYQDPRVRGAILFASPAAGAYNGVITAAGLARVRRPVFCVFGTDDMGQPGSYLPGSPPATSPRGQGVQAMLQGDTPLLVAACLLDANHFEYGAQPAAPGSLNAQRIDYLNALVLAFADLLLRELPACGPFGDGGWVDPSLVAWSAQRCALPSIAFGGAGCATSAGVPLIGTSGGAPLAGNASFTLTLQQAPAGAAFVTGLQPGAALLPVGVAFPGAPACALLFLQPSQFVFAFADAAGRANLPLPLLPAGPSLWGLLLSAQHAVFDFDFPGFQGAALPFGTSAGLQLRIGS